MRSTQSKDIEECVGVRVPCWDAKRRVWQAIDVVRRDQQRNWGFSCNPSKSALRLRLLACSADLVRAGAIQIAVDGRF